MRMLTLLLPLLLISCQKNMDKAPPATEYMGNRFILEATASTPEGNYIYVLRDKANGNLIYLTPASGVYVQQGRVGRKQQ